MYSHAYEMYGILLLSVAYYTKLKRIRQEEEVIKYVMCIIILVNTKPNVASHIYCLHEAFASLSLRLH